MDLTVNSRMAEYYERFIELQEKLRKSEEERMKLEMKFGEMMQKSREEEQVYYKRLRSQYKKFLDEDKKRQERNEKIVRTLERIETRIDMLTSKTERFKSLRKQYRSYLQRTSATHEPKFENSLSIDKSQYSYLDDEHFNRAQKTTNDEKMEILDKYLDSISSEKCKELIEKRRQENAELEKLDVIQQRLNNGFDSNKAQSIAEDIMNSIYNRHYKKDQLTDQNYSSSGNDKPTIKFALDKNDVINYGTEADISKLNKDLSNTNDKQHYLNKIQNDIKEKEKRAFVEDSHELGYVPSDVSTNRDETDDDIEEEDNNSVIESQYRGDNDENKQCKSKFNKPESESSKIERPVSNETEDFVEVKKYDQDIREFTEYEAHDPPVEINSNINDSDSLVQDSNLDTAESKEVISSNLSSEMPVTEYPVSNEPLHETSKEQISDKVIDQIPLSNKYEDIGDIKKINPIVHDENNQQEIEQSKKNDENGAIDEYDQSNPQYNENKSEVQTGKNDQLNQFDKNGQPVQYDQQGQDTSYDQNGQKVQYDQNGQPFQYDENGQPVYFDQSGQMIQYDENGQVIQYDDQNQIIQYDNQGEPVQYDEQGQPIHYDQQGQRIQYDEHGQLIQYDEHGQPVQYDKHGQSVQYDEHGQPVEYDEHGQPVQYDKHGQPVQYDERGQPVQYDEHGQPVQYDEHGQPVQYDEHGQPVQYDKHGQPVQYDERGQLVQYDEHGQPLQYDEHSQLIQYDEKGQPIYNYPQYDGQGQPVEQYDENGQIIPYEGYDSNNQNYEQYDENGRVIDGYPEGVQQEVNAVSNADAEHFGEQILPTTNPDEENSALEDVDENQPKINKILEMLDTDTESLQQNVSKVSNDSDFTVTT